MPKIDRPDRIEFRLTPEEGAQLDKLCEGTGLTRSGYIRMLIHQNYNREISNGKEINNGREDIENNNR